MITPTTPIRYNPDFDPTAWTRDAVTGGRFGDFTVVVANTPELKAEVARWLAAGHYLGEHHRVGHTLCHIVCEDARPVAVLAWAACAYHLKDREAHIGWTALQCAMRRNLVVNNVRFLVLGEVRRKNLASKALAHSVKTLAAHWREAFGYEPLLAETFTDTQRFEGTCYKAAGWTPLGLTEGSSRQRSEFYVSNDNPKKLWVKELRTDALERLRAAELAPEHIGGETEGRGAPLPLRVTDLATLWDTLRTVKDPRRRKTYHIGTMLSLLAFGLLCGATNLLAVTRFTVRLNQAQRRRLNLPIGKDGLHRCPSYESYRQVLLGLDLEDFALKLSVWLSAHRGVLPAHLAIDGKAIRGTLAKIVTLCDTEQKVPVAVAATLQSGGELACSRALLAREETCLLNATLTGDALYNSAEEARFIPQEKGSELVAAIKGNQAAILERIEHELTTGTTGADGRTGPALMEPKAIETPPKAKGKPPERRTILVPTEQAAKFFSRTPRRATAR